MSTENPTYAEVLADVQAAIPKVMERATVANVLDTPDRYALNHAEHALRLTKRYLIQSAPAATEDKKR